MAQWPKLHDMPDPKPFKECNHYDWLTLTLTGPLEGERPTSSEVHGQVEDSGAKSGLSETREPGQMIAELAIYSVCYSRW